MEWNAKQILEQSSMSRAASQAAAQMEVLVIFKYNNNRSTVIPQIKYIIHININYKQFFSEYITLLLMNHEMGTIHMIPFHRNNFSIPMTAAVVLKAANKHIHKNNMLNI